MRHFRLPVDNLQLSVPVDYYPNRTVAELLISLEALQKRATEGSISMSSSVGLQQMKSFQGSEPIRVAIKQVLYSLWRKDPVTYQNPYAQVIRTATTRYV